MDHNPYAAPVAAVAEARAFGPKGSVRIYSPGQAAAGAFLGGPVALVYFLAKNFEVLGKSEAERRTVISGIVGTLLLIPVLLLLPDSVPGMTISLIYLIIARQVAEKYQMTKQAIVESPVYDFHSNWRVFWLGLACLVGSVIVLVAGVAGFTVLGFG